MKNRYHMAVLLIVLLVVLFILTGCNNESNNLVNNEDVKVNEIIVEDNTKISTKKEIDPITSAWLNLPENLNYSIKKVYNDKNIVIGQYYKRGNDILEASETRNDGIRPSTNNRLENVHYFYKYVNDDVWKSYMYTLENGWDEYYFNGSYPTKMNSNEVLMLTKLDNYTNSHEKIYVESLGYVDTVIGIAGEIKYYYSEKYNINVKVEAKAYTWTLTKYELDVSDYPYTLPNI